LGRMLQPCRTQAAVTTSARASKRRSGGPFSILTGKRPKNFTSKPQRKTKVKPSCRQSMSSLQRVSVCRDVATEHGHECSIAWIPRGIGAVSHRARVARVVQINQETPCAAYCHLIFGA
jgi:hypothetical protein